jgi:hypothetical protein
MTKTSNKKTKSLFNLNDFYLNLAMLVTKKKPFTEAAANKVEELKQWPEDFQKNIDKHPDVMSHLDKANALLQSPENLKELKKRVEAERHLASRRGRYYEPTPQAKDDLELVKLIWDIATNDNSPQPEDSSLTTALSNFNEVFTSPSDDGKSFDFGGGDMGGGGAGGSYSSNDSYSSPDTGWSSGSSSYDSGSSGGGGDWFKQESRIKPAIYKKRLTL